MFTGIHKLDETILVKGLYTITFDISELPVLRIAGRGKNTCRGLHPVNLTEIE